MPTVSGHIYYDNSNVYTPGTGIANVPVALFDPTGLTGAIALTDATGAFSFTNVPNGTYQLIETWGTTGGISTPVNYPAALIPMPSAPIEAEPPLSALSVVPPILADQLQALTPNLLNITVAGVDVLNQNFFDGPVGDKPLTLSGVSMVGANLITDADNGTWGSNPPGTLGNTRPAINPYPSAVPGFTYTTALVPADGQFTVTNTAIGWVGPPWWITSDHTTGLETGRFQMVNGANPGNAFFNQSVSVTPNTNYALAAWIMNLINFNGATPPRIGIEVLDSNGNTLFSQAVNPIPNQPLPVWFQNGFIFNSGANSNVTVRLNSLGPQATGNDYAIDDITLFEVQSLLTQNKTFTPSTIYSQTGVGVPATVSVTVSNPTAQTINNVTFQDVIDPNLLFTPGSVTVDNVPNVAANPNLGFSLGSLAPGQSIVVMFQVTTTGGPMTIPNTANIAYDALTSDTGDVTRANFPSNTANLDVIINNAVVTTTKSVDLAFAKPNDVLTYTLTLNNSGNVAASNVIITDIIPAGTTFIPGSLTGATGTPPTLTLLTPIAPNGSTTVTFKVNVGATIPVPNPLVNSATVAFTFTVDPASPNGASGNSSSNAVTTQINGAIVATTKTADLAYAAPGDIITYTLLLSNSGNTAANSVVITDSIPTGTTFVPGSLTGATGTPPTLMLLAPITAGGNATITFQVKVGASIPVPNPLINEAAVAFRYTVDPQNPDGVIGTSTSNATSTQVNGAIVDILKTVDKNYAEQGDVLTYTLVLKNNGNIPANNVVITDTIPSGTTFVAGSLTGATGTPPIFALPLPLPVNGTTTITFQVIVGDTLPVPNPVANSASAIFTFTTDPSVPDGRTGSSNSNTVNTQINSAIVTANKVASSAFANVGDTVTYTITLTNSGNVTANQVVITDVIPAGSTFVLGSLVGMMGTPPNFTVVNPIPAGGTITVSFDVLIGSSVPNPNPLENTASIAFAYTVDPANPNGASGTILAGPAITQVNTAKLAVTKSADKAISYIGDIITYQIAVKNTGNVAANNVILTDVLPINASFVPGSLIVSVPYSGTLATGLSLTNPIASGQIVSLTFKAKVDSIPVPNPMFNQATATYTFTVDPAFPNSVAASDASNLVSTIVFRYNYSQQSSDLIESVALEQAALAAIANAEGAKIQKIVAMSGVTTQEMLCINKSVNDMLDSLNLLESVLKQKLAIIECQINGSGANCK